MGLQFRHEIHYEHNCKSESKHKAKLTKTKSPFIKACPVSKPGTNIANAICGFGIFARTRANQVVKSRDLSLVTPPPPPHLTLGISLPPLSFSFLI